MDFTSFTTIILVLFLIIGGYLVFTNQIEGRAKMILIVALLIVFIVIFINLPMFKSYSEFVSSPLDATQPFTIPGTSYTNSTSYSISSWIYINDWNTHLGRKKVILQRINGTKPNPSFALDEFENNLTIKFQEIATTNNTPVLKTITIPNISIQKWVNITSCFGDKTVDTYINGKLVNTFVTDNPQNISMTSQPVDINITPDGGFAGSISNVRYYNIFLTPQQVWDIYNSGVNSSFLNQFNASFTFYQNQNVKAQFYLM